MDVKVKVRLVSAVHTDILFSTLVADILVNTFFNCSDI